MQVLKKLSAIGTGIPTAPVPGLKHKASSFKPATRLEKIRQNKLIYPASTYNKFVFISNLDGIGFQRQIYVNCPESIKLDDMVSKINSICYKQWQINKEHYHNNPFKRLDLITNCSMVLMCLLALILYILHLQNSFEIQTLLYIFLTVVISTMITSLSVYFKQNDEYDSDFQTIKAIKAHLQQLNNQQNVTMQGNSRFVWSCHKECIWIAIKILRFDNE